MSSCRHRTRAEISQNQFHQLRTLLRTLIPDNRFYTEKLGLVAADVSSLDAYTRLAWTTKDELVANQQRHPPYGTNLTFPLEDYTRYHQTSGTSGLPLRWLDTDSSWDRMIGSWLKILEAAGVTRADRIFFAFSFGPFIGFWLAFEAAVRMGCLCLPGGGLNSVARLKCILDNEATVLCCTPTYAFHLAEVAAREQIRLENSKVRRIIVAGEPGGSVPATRAQLNQLWRGAAVFDHHGMTEVGPVTYECPLLPGTLHVLEDDFFPEILEPGTGRKTPAGEIGELVLTTLGRVGSPLLRYRTGDCVRQSPADTCLCGRSEMALQGGILSRVDDMVVVRGVNIYPRAIDEIIRACGGIAEYQVRLQNRTGLAEISVAIEPEPGCADVHGLVQRVENQLQSAFPLRIPVLALAPQSLPRFEMKARRWVVS